MRTFEQLTSMEAINNFIHNNQLALLFVSQPNCSVCHGLMPQVQILMENYPEINLGHINALDVAEFAGQFSIFTVPVILLFVEGREYIREARIVHMDLFANKINKLVRNFMN